MKHYREEFLSEAIRLSTENVINGGGPFGALVARGDQIIATGVNRVTDNCDPTAHAEVVAIRNACTALGTFQLDDCVVYTSCEPCPMCLGAIYWSRPKAVFFANGQAEAAEFGFDDRFIYEEIAVEPEQRKIPMVQVKHTAALDAFKQWEKNENRVDY